MANRSFRERRRESLEMQRIITSRMLAPLKEAVERGEIDGRTVLATLAEKTGFTNITYTPDYKKFRDNSTLIYENEIFLETGYAMRRGGSQYKFSRASQFDIHVLYKLYRHLSNAPYDSPEELREIMRALLNDMRILEIGCGPGFNLHVLKMLGARVYGIELREETVGSVPDVDIRIGNAMDVALEFPPSTFDLVYSRDFFSSAVIESPAEAARIVAEIYGITRSGGLSIHQMIYAKVYIPLSLFGLWLECRKTGFNYDRIEKGFWKKLLEGNDDEIYTNRSALDPQDLLRTGFGIREYSIEDDNLHIVAQK